MVMFMYIQQYVSNDVRSAGYQCSLVSVFLLSNYSILLVSSSKISNLQLASECKCFVSVRPGRKLGRHVFSCGNSFHFANRECIQKLLAEWLSVQSLMKPDG